MNAAQPQARGPELDTSDLERWVGVPLGGAHLKDDVHVNDIRRWVQGMQNPNPLHYDEQVAAASRFGRLLAPQSFAVCTDDSHGAAPAIQGHIPGTHMIFGGDEWWFRGPRIAPGDRIRQDRMLFDFKVAETKFAGPTVFSRGDTRYIRQDGVVLCKQRSTSIRYRADLARERGLFLHGVEPVWSEAELAGIEQQRLEYHQSIRALGHARRLGVRVGDALPRRVLGPHSVASFATEWRAFLMSVWGAFAPDAGPSSLWQAGWLPEMDRDHEAARIDPARADGLYEGPSRGHVQERYARLVGMPRGYGYGASMGAWVLDYLANWAGEWGEIRHSRMQYRAPALTGDVTYLCGTVTGLAPGRAGLPVASIEVRMTNQRDELMASGSAEVELPAEDAPAR